MTSHPTGQLRVTMDRTGSMEITGFWLGGGQYSSILASNPAPHDDVTKDAREPGAQVVRALTRGEQHRLTEVMADILGIPTDQRPQLDH